jgi:hypothetical protein
MASRFTAAYRRNVAPTSYLLECVRHKRKLRRIVRRCSHQGVGIAAIQARKVAALEWDVQGKQAWRHAGGSEAEERAAIIGARPRQLAVGTECQNERHNGVRFLYHLSVARPAVASDRATPAVDCAPDT